MVSRTFFYRLCRRKFFLRSLRIYFGLHLPGQIRGRNEILAHAIRSDLSRLCFFSAADGAVVFLCGDEIKIPALRVGYRPSKVRIIAGHDAHASLGPRKRARMEFSLLEPFRRIVLLSPVSIVASRFRAKVPRPFAILCGRIVDRRLGYLRHLSMAQARRLEHHKFRSDQRILAERPAI